MEKEKILNVSDPLQIDCLRYCFGDIIKEDILVTRKEWNEHHVRKQKNRNVEGGIPNVLYKCPEKFGATNYMKEVDLGFVQYLQETYTQKPILVSPDFEKLANELLNMPSTPSTVEETFDLYLTLTDAIKKLESSLQT